MSKIGNEARLIQKVVEGKIDFRIKEMDQKLAIGSDLTYQKGLKEGMRWVMAQFEIVSNDIERNN
jgi:hypothetical protein